MATASSLFLSVALILAVTLGPQSRPWTWGPSLLFMAVAVLLAIPEFWKNRKFLDGRLVTLCCIAAGWFAWRAWFSPVKEYGIADLLLLSGTIGSFLVARTISVSKPGLLVFQWTLAAILLGSVVVVAIQTGNPLFSPFLGKRPSPLPSGFYQHYNEGANFLIASSFLLVGSALLGKHTLSTRVVWGVISVAGIAAVYFTRSRGAILGITIGAAVFTVMLLIHGKRVKALWFLPLLIAFLVASVVGPGVLVTAWLNAQDARQYNPGMEGLMDNTIRLSLMGIALSCIGTHPWAGGGSRSFSWECYQFWNVQENGWTATRPEMVHNELLQAFSDYGIIGGFLISSLLLTIGVGTVLKMALPGTSPKHPHANAFYTGGIAALSGMLVQSSFSFVFHLLPGAIMLGICLGRVSLPLSRVGIGSPVPRPIPKSTLTLVALAAAAFMLPYAWKGTRIMTIAGSTYFNGEKVPLDEKLDALADALSIWPQSSIYKDRSLLLHKVVHDQLSKRLPTSRLEEVIAGYRAGLDLNPFDPTLSLNLGNLLAELRRDDEALAEYRRTAHLQGGMELAFYGNSRVAETLLKIARRQITDEDPDSAIDSLSEAALFFDKATQGNPSLPGTAEGVQLRNSIYDSLGIARELAGDREGALETYDRMISFGTGTGNYRSAILLGNMADTAYAERKPSEAHTKFLEARKRMAAAQELPLGTDPAQKDEFLAYFDRMIEFFVTTRVPPLEESR